MGAYLTKIHDVRGLTAIGSRGEQLIAIGNRPLENGMYVWTDGRVIFGHTRRKAATPFIPRSTDDSVIPVLCTNLEGYFDMDGNFRSKKLPVTGYFVNDSYNFYPVPGDASDAEISVGKGGKTDGYRYIHYENKTVEIYKNDNLERKIVLKNFLSDKDSQIVNVDFFTLTENGNYYFVFTEYRNQISYEWSVRPSEYVSGSNQEGYSYFENGIKQKTEYIFHEIKLIKNGDIEKRLDYYKCRRITIYDYGRTEGIYAYEPVGRYYIYIGEKVIRKKNMDDANIETSYDSESELTLPIQDDYEKQYMIQGSEIEVVVYSEKSHGVFIDSGNVDELSPVDVLDKVGNVVFTIRYPDSHLKAVAKLNGGKYLIGFQNHGLYMYSPKNGLEKIGTGLRNFRLRKMKKMK